MAGGSWGATAWRSTAWLDGVWAQAGDVPVITTTVLPGGAVGVGYLATLRATGDVPITWEVTTGAPPGGLLLSTAGVLSGAPTDVESQTFTVTATNQAGTDTQEYTVAIGTAASGGGANREARRGAARGLLRLVGRG